MNVLEQLRAMGFEEKPLQFYDGGEGGGGDPSGGEGGGGGEGPGGTDVSSENTADYGGPAPGPSSYEVENVFDPSGTAGKTISGYGGAGDVNPDVLADIASSNIGQSWSSPGGREARAALDALATLGYGKMEGVNPANPTQTVENLIASSKTDWGITNVAVPALMAVVPGANTAMALGKGIAGLASGQISIGQSVANTAISLAASQMGLPTGTFAAMINGDMGKAAANTAMGAFTQALSSATNLPSGIIGTALNATGFGKEANQAITGMINQGLGITPSNNVGAIGSAIDQALGFTPGGGFNLSVDAAGNPTFNPSDFSGTGGPSEPPATAPSPAPAPAAQSGANTAAALAALAALGMQEDDRPEEYKVAQIPVQSPFGTLPYGMDKTMPYGLRG